MIPPKPTDSAVPPCSNTSIETLARTRLNSCRSRAWDYIERATTALIDAIDDQLFNLSEEQREQPLSFDIYDVMRDFRVARSRLETQFRRRFSEIFATCLDGHLELPPELPNSAFNHSLNRRPDAKMPLNPVNLVMTINASCQTEIAKLDPLLTQLCKQAGCNSNVNPLGPHMIVASCISFAKLIQAEIRIQPVTAQMLEECVIPLLKPMYVDLYKQLSREAANLKANNPGMPVVPLPQPIAQLDADGVVDELTRLQKLDFSHSVYLKLDFGPELITDPSHSFLRRFTSTEVGRTLLKTHELSIELTAMFFDQIFNDTNLADEFRPLIGRLQIPLLKVAILDKSLFSKRNNPARVMLSNIYEIGQVWGLADKPSRAIVDHVDAITHALVQQFGRNTALFAQFVEKMKPLCVWAETQRNNLPQSDPVSVRRSKEITAGLNRLDKSKSTVRATVQQRINNLSLPDPVRNFIQNQWTNLLVVTHFKEGENSRDWSFAVKSMDALIWSIQPKDSKESRDKLSELKPSLIKRLKEGAQRISMPIDEVSRFMDTLSSLHELALMNLRPSDHIEIDSLREETMPPSDTTRKLTVNQSGKQPTNIASTVHEFPTPTRAQKTNNLATQPIPDMGQGIEEIILSSDDCWSGHIGDDQFLEQVQNLTPGTWFRFHENTDGNQLARLVWINKSTGKYVFSDQRGRKLAEKSAVELANELRNNLASVIDQTSDRMRAQSEIKSAD